jgi:radical SAM protein with 4Fe4S-binding SPASM domain
MVEFAKRIEWEITNLCNLECPHCNKSKNCKDLTDEETIDLANQLGENSVEIVSLSGGEPFVRENWSEIVDVLRKHNVEVQIITNGYYINNANIKKLESRNVNLVWLSLDGILSVHDDIRGLKGSFGKVLKAVQLLKQSNLQFGIVTTILKHNMNQLIPLSMLIKDMNPLYWHVWLGVPQNENDMWFDPDDSPKLFKILSDIKKTTPQLILGDNLGYGCSFDHSRVEGFEGCGAGRTIAGIKNDGSIKGCMMLPEKSLKVNIKGKNLLKVFEKLNKSSIKRYEKIKQEHENCKNSWMCNGGCHAMILSTNKLNFCDYCYMKNQKTAKHFGRNYGVSIISTVLMASSLFISCSTNNSKTNNKEVKNPPPREHKAKTSENPEIPKKVDLKANTKVLKKSKYTKTPKCCYSRAVIPGCKCDYKRIPPLSRMIVRRVPVSRVLKPTPMPKTP